MALSAQTMAALNAAIGNGCGTEIVGLVNQVTGTTTAARVEGSSTAQLKAGSYSVVVSSSGVMALTSPTIALVATGGSVSISAGDFSINSGSATLSNGVVDTNTSVTLTGATTDNTAQLSLDPDYTGAFTIDRHNYIKLEDPAVSGSTVTDACALWFDANAGTHKAVDSGTTKTSPGTVTCWIKVNVNGAIRYIPAYSSKTS